MMKVVIPTAAIAFVILAVVVLLSVFGETTQNAEYLKFGLTLLLFLVILVGSYGFVYWASGGREEE